MINRLLILTLALAILACGSKQSEKETADSTVISASPSSNEPVQNQLSEEQKSTGWKLLFDGQTLNGWKFFKSKPNDSWEVIDGTLHCKPFDDTKENQRADIMTVDQYENFELSFDWKISAQGNSGVIFRVTEENDQPYLSGPEYQVMDLNSPGDIKDVHKTGANYDMHAPTTQVSKATGEWNQSILVVNKNHVEHWLNGTKVVEYDLNSEDWKKRKAAGKWKDVPTYGASSKGYIDFQDHNQEAWFRNIRVRIL